MLFTSTLAGVLPTRDAGPVERTGWMRSSPVPDLNPSAYHRLAPGVYLVRRSIAWPVTVFDIAERLPWDEDVEPIPRQFPYPVWHQRAACPDTPDYDIVFFGADDEQNVPGRPPGQFQRKARLICRGCPVQRECLTHALTQPSRSACGPARPGGSATRCRRGSRRGRASRER
jgi:hypothetical protein